MPVLKVEDGGAVLRGVALPFNEPAIVSGPKGSLVQEVMDQKSVEKIAENLPLLVGHDRARPPAGLVRTARISSRGVLIEAELVGSDDELEGWRRRFRQGLSAGLSVGFTRDRDRDLYEKPSRSGGFPVLRPRGVTIHEISIVQWPAYPSAGVISLSLRNALDQDRHERSERIIDEWNMKKATKRGREILEAKAKHK